MINYHIQFRDSHSLLVRLEEKGSRRILYLDTLKILAKEADKEALALLTKFHLRSTSSPSETLSFQQIAVSAAQSNEALKSMAKTQRLFFQGKQICQVETGVKLYWRGEEHSKMACTLVPVLQVREKVFPLESCELVFPGEPFWFFKEGTLGFISTSLPWKWIEYFLKGPRLLEGMQKKKFLEEEPPILWKEKAPEAVVEVFPELILRDATGCFADLWMEYRGVGRVAFEDLAPTVHGRARMREAESHWEKDLLESGFLRKQVGHSHYYCPSEKMRSALLFLLEMGWKLVDFKNRRVLKQSGLEAKISEENGGIAMRGHVQFQQEKSSLQAAMQAAKKGRMWIELNEGNVGLLDGIEILDGEWREETLHLKRQQTAQLSSFLDAEGVQWEETVRKAAEGLRKGATPEPALPGPSFRGELLSYQQKGVDWLWFLYRSGFSGLLADEMGLGKTVQVLAFFSRLRTNLPILIVAPTSLLFNWRAEISRFLGAPVYLHAGQERCTRPSDLQRVPWILTSYALLRLDEELFSQVEFEAIALDESSAIKTAATQTANAACKLKSRFRIALNGTPIENRPEELWSQFRFLMPDLLKERTDFQASDPERLKRKLRPFILRRKKEEVQIDLPEKIEQIVWLEMNEAQTAVYHSYCSSLKSGLLKKVEREGVAAHRMEVLEAILRLRQICADPRLLGSIDGGAKVEQLLLDLEEGVAEKRKILIYSQFTSMLQLMGKELGKKGLKYLYLDGSTPHETRGELVEKFQEDPEVALFLLSLKAGGVGLNLTAADTVILFDPWWNEAVENQAIDRAHRIGQKKTVLAKRYLVPDSIEEKMLKLKTLKTKASEQLLDLESEQFSWTEEDLLHLLL